MAASATSRKPFTTILRPRHVKAFFYVRCKQFNFEKLVYEYVAFFTPKTTPSVCSLGQMSEQICLWNRFGPSPTKQRGYRYEHVYSEVQAKESLMESYKGNWRKWSDLTTPQQDSIGSFFSRTLTVCKTPEAFYQRLSTTDKLCWYNPTRKGERQTVSEFCYYNGFEAAAFLTVQEGDKVLSVSPESTQNLDSWLKGDEILNRTIPVLYEKTEAGCTPIAMDAFIVEE